MVGGGTGSDATFDLDWAGNIGLLTTSPSARTEKGDKENSQSQETRSRKQRPEQGNVSAKLSTDKAHVLREQSNRGLAHASGSDWKSVKAQACDLESKGQLQGALNLINEAIQQSGRPLEEMLQFQSDLQCRLNAAGQLNKQAVQMAIHRPGRGANGTEASQNSDMCTPSIAAFPQALSFDSQNFYGTTGGGLHPNPSSVSSRTPDSMSTPTLPRAEASVAMSTPDTSSSDDHVGIGVRIQPEMRAETPLLQLTQSTEDADVLVNGDTVEAITNSVGTMMLNPDDECAESSESDNSGDSTSMRVSGMQDNDSQQTAQSKSTKARCSSVRFSKVESVAFTRSPPTPMNGSAACGDASRSQIQNAGHTPYSAAVQSQVTFADQTISVSQQTPGVCSNQEGHFVSESSDSENEGQLQGFRSLNAGATPRRCDQSHVKFCQSTPEVAPADSDDATLPITPDAEGMGELSADESRHLSMNAGCTPGAGHLSCGAHTQGVEAAEGASMDGAETMRTNTNLVAGAFQLDGAMRAPAAIARYHVDTDSSAIAACLTFKSDAAQDTAAAHRCQVRGEKLKPTGALKWPAEQSGLRGVSPTEPASAPPVVGALFRTPAQGTSSLLHENVRTAGLPTVPMHGSDTDHAFDTIQENNSFLTESPSGLAACQSTPTLHGVCVSAPNVSPSTGTPVAGGCHTATGKREGTPAFGAVDGLDDEPGSCTGTDCSMTPELPAVDGSVELATISSTVDSQSETGSAASMQAPAGATKPTRGVTIAVNDEDGSPGDAMISPWLQSEADRACPPSTTCADGDGGFGSPVGPVAPWTGFDAVHAVSEASTPSLAREGSSASRSPATLSMKGASPSTQTPPSQLARATRSSSSSAPMERPTASTAQTSQSERTPDAVWAQAESQAGFFQSNAVISRNAECSTPHTASSRDTVDLLRESPATDELLKESPSPRLVGPSPRLVSSSPMSPPSPLQHNASPSPPRNSASGGTNDQKAAASSSPAQASVGATELPLSPGAMAIIVAAGMAAGSPLTGEQSVTAAATPPGSPVLAAPLACPTQEPVTPGTRTAVGLGKLRTPGRRELKAILSDSVAQHAVETLKGENDMSYATARADNRQQRKHQSCTVLTPVRRSRRSQVQPKVPLTDQLHESGWTYSPNPALMNRKFSRAEEELLDSMAQLNMQQK